MYVFVFHRCRVINLLLYNYIDQQALSANYDATIDTSIRLGIYTYIGYILYMGNHCSNFSTNSNIYFI